MELNELPAKIEGLDKKITQLQAVVASPDFFQQEQTKINDKLKELSDAQKDLEKAYERWAELDNL